MILYVSRQIRMRRMSQSGSSLVIVLVIIALATILFASVLGYSATANKATSAYSNVRNARYSGSNAIEAAVNWARLEPNVGRDPSLSASAVDCMRRIQTDVGPVKVSCEPNPDAQSGVPADVGMVPPEGLLLLSNRNVNTPNTPGTSGPYNNSACKGWWDSVVGWFKNGVDPNTGTPEYSALFADRKNLGTLAATCAATGRGKTDFLVYGDFVAAGRIHIEDTGSAAVQGKNPAGSEPGVYATSCSDGVTCITPPGNRTNGTPRSSDPARPATPGVNPVDVTDAWQSVAFKQNGALRDEYSTSCASGKRCFPVRTTAYRWTPGTPSPGPTVPAGLTATATCVGSSATIVFLPGWYKSSEVLNRYTKNAGSCTGVTFWFAPDPGPDNLLLTADDITGPYYFDFRDPANATGCNDYPVNAARWCIGGSAGQNPRVSAGTPKGWSPLGGAPINPPPGGDTRPRNKVMIDTAATIDKDLSVKWNNAEKANKIDGNLAHYAPCWFIFTCPSIDRAIRVREFSPRVTNGPIDDTGFPNGRIYISVAYGIVDGESVDDAKVEVTAVSNESGHKSCGTYNVGRIAYSGSGPLPAPYRFTDSQAKQLADVCSSIDLINGLEIKLIVTGNGINWPLVPNVYFDGAAIEYDSFHGASFPADTAPDDLKAKSDCDPNGVGAQFIFGGESHVYVADGSIEICAGRFPTSPEDHQVIGVYGLPTVAPITASSIVSGGGDDGSTVLNPNNAKTINAAGGEGAQSSTFATIRYGGCAGYCGQEYEEGRATITMSAYSPPPGYKVGEVRARVSYNPKNELCATGLWGCPGAEPQLRFAGCGTIDLPKNPDKGNLQFANNSSLLLYKEGRSGNCFSTTDLTNGVGFTYAARAKCQDTFFVGWVCKAGGGDWNDQLDGVEFDVVLIPDGTAPVLLPQQGCITAYPNYAVGEGTPDCAVIRADTRASGDTWSWPWATKEATWTGRISVKGMIYTPSAAIEIDDSDIAYPIASRGAVMRHLRASGWKSRGRVIGGKEVVYQDASFGSGVDKTPIPREMVFTSCIQTTSRQNSAAHCDAAAGDKLLARSAVRFEIDPTSGIPDADRSRVAKVLWWSTDL